MAKLVCLRIHILQSFILLIISSQIMNTSSAQNSYNVVNYGANPNGKTDSTKAFLDAWTAACRSTGSSMIYVPVGNFLLGSVSFQGSECTSHDITIRIDGTLVAPGNYRSLEGADSWLTFHLVNGVSIVGNGAINAKGSPLWDCKTKGGNCPQGATSLKLMNSNNVKIKGLTSIDSQMFHIVIHECQDVLVQGVKVIAPDESPNTDGIHVQQSTNVLILDSSIKTGDDCISIGPGTSNLWIQGIKCGPGHGISIGSLAKMVQEEGVRNVTVKDTIFSGTENGFRIKSWARPSTGFVQEIRFIGATINNVRNPILIDQFYCPQFSKCPIKGSGVKINDVTYQGIQGTSASAVAIKFNCNSNNPCTSLKLQDIDLSYLNRGSQSSCANVDGRTVGKVQPNDCL